MAYADPGAPFVIERATIRMPYLPENLASFRDRYPVVTPGSPMRLRKIAEQLGRQFTRETHYDPIYSALDPGPAVVLLPSRDRHIGQARLIAGAIGIADFEEGWGATWFYVHPYERGRGLVDEAWLFITERWPGVVMVGPFTGAGAALRKRLERNAHRTAWRGPRGDRPGSEA